MMPIDLALFRVESLFAMGVADEWWECFGIPWFVQPVIIRVMAFLAFLVSKPGVNLRHSWYTTLIGSCMEWHPVKRSIDPKFHCEASQPTLFTDRVLSLFGASPDLSKVLEKEGQMIQPPKSSLMGGTLSSRQGTAKTQHVRPKKSLSSSESKGSTFGDELQLKVFRCYAFEVKKRSRSQTFQNTWFLMRDSAFFS